MNRFVPLRFLTLALAAALTLTACDSGDPEEQRVGISGSWAGDLISIDTTGTQPDTLRLPIEMTLDDDRSRVVGSGSVQTPTETLLFDVTSGLFAPPNLTLALRFDRPPQGTISGNVSPERDAIDASVSGPGLVNGRTTFTLVMQRME